MLLYAPGHTKEFCEPVRGSTWLQKMMFIISRSVPGLNPGFRGHYFGAFSRSLKEAQGRGVRAGLVSRSGVRGAIRLTDRGARAARMQWDALPEEERSAISRTKEILNEMGYWEMISAVYATYPETTSKSEIAGDFGGRRLEAAVSLHKRGSVSLLKAVSISGVSRDEFEAELERRGIPSFELDSESHRESMRAIEGIA